ncbi:MAG: SDR family NAD(P)-dependent oxidoreductase [Planctomycetia bacterium]|nr:SDR family NAD(P)-dependent oxidoreductase [Planctomycetia bacterium]
MTPAVAIVGMACRYPDARSPDELWENVLAQRRAFRRMPPERLRLADYWSPDRGTADATYSAQAAVVEDYEFDREKFRVSGSTFRAADMTHWLALDIAGRALADAGFAQGDGLTKTNTGVLLGNSLTGEFSRANLMRLRWPYVRRVVDATLARCDCSLADKSHFLDELAELYKAPFPPVGDETLAGGLSNTIAGRICNHFDFKGGGYTVDGACASSLLAVANACSALLTRDLDVAIAGGVDLSLDPFELVGFAKVGALALEQMRVYDARSAGFWPGEGCGMVVLMRHGDAVEQGRRIYAVIRGWGISSDGQGGITRPEVAGQQLALERAYRRAGFGIDTVSYFEGHGTGTAIGDATELKVLSFARRAANSSAPPAAIGSIKANIGHTKAAAGLAGLIKTTMALQTQLLPPTCGWETPHPELKARDGQPPALELLREGKAWPADQPLRAGVSAMGFGGINTHLVLEGIARQRRRTLDSASRCVLGSMQDAELFLLSAADRNSFAAQVSALAVRAEGVSLAEMGDLAAELSRRLEFGPVRAAVVAASPSELAGRLKTLASWLEEGLTERLDARGGIALGLGTNKPRIGFLFPGQGSPAHLTGGIWRLRFDAVAELYASAALPVGNDGVATEIAQPAICTASLAALRMLERLGIEASVGVGQSLGELTAYCWAGAMDEAMLLRVAGARGKAVADFGKPGGGMASIAAAAHVVRSLLLDSGVVIAGFNSAKQTIVSGELSAVAAVVANARAHGLEAVTLPVSHAFHSPLVADAAAALARHLARETLGPLHLPVASTITGTLLEPHHNLAQLLEQQMNSPVRLIEAVDCAADRVNLWIEMGPGTVMRGIMGALVDTPVLSLDAAGESLRPLLDTLAAAFTLGVPIRHRALFEGRFTRAFNLERPPRFLANPCELAPTDETAITQRTAGRPEEPPPSAAATAPLSELNGAAVRPSASDIVKRLVAKHAELPLAVVKEEDHLLRDLHLSSLAVGHLVAEAARELGLPAPASPTDYAQATVAEVAAALAQFAKTGAAAPVHARQEVLTGVDQWIRPFVVELVERELPPSQVSSPSGSWRVIAPRDLPLAEILRQRASSLPGKGVILCLPPRPDDRHVPLFLEAARAIPADAGERYFIVVQQDGGGGSFARTLHLEMAEVATCVIDLPQDHPQAADWVVAEIRAARGYAEAHYDRAGTRREPVWRLAPSTDETGALPLGPDDVLLVTGGGKGIAAESALWLAQRTGAKLALVGRSHPDLDGELAANLRRLAAAGANVRYYAADVTDRVAVRQAIAQAQADLGSITAILHGAGTNVPRLISALDDAAFLETLKPKVAGLRNVLSAVDQEQLRLLISFGSIIARTGLRGEADYAVANEWLVMLCDEWAAGHPHCRCLSIEWSVWSGVGMGERLGRIDLLKQQGITPITPDEGVKQLGRLLRQPALPSAVVVTGRFGDPPTARIDRPELPLWRFIERPRVYVPGVELIVDVNLSAGTDPHIPDHVFQGAPLFAAVMGLEAMAQVALALTGSSSVAGFERVELERPIVVPEGTVATVRLAALVREPGVVEVVVRAAETGYQVDHFRAVCRVASQPAEELATSLLDHGLNDNDEPVAIDPRRDLYGRLLFHRGQFQRLARYRRLEATACIAEIAALEEARWFGGYLSDTLLLGDPGARDAAVHAIQACIPHATILPIGVDRIVRRPEPLAAPCVVHAQERSHQDDTFVYDMEIVGTDGRVCERWEGLRLRQVRATLPQGAWTESLLGPYLQRRVGELIPGAVASVAVQLDGQAERTDQSDRAIQRALGRSTKVYRRPDGKPEVTGESSVSVAHSGRLTLSVAASGPVGCDAETITCRPVDLWRDLLGSQRNGLAVTIARQDSGEFDKAATRIWAAGECLKKAGVSLDAPLVVQSASPDGWVLLRTGSLSIATYSANVNGVKDPLVLAILLKS